MASANSLGAKPELEPGKTEIKNCGQFCGHSGEREIARIVVST
jgi:hypothetical protein